MAEFSFDEFVNKVNNVKAADETARKQQIVRIILKAMDDLCPNSYMPFLFIHASTTDNAEFVNCKKSTIKAINEHLMVTNEETIHIIQKSQRIANSMIEMMKIANKVKGYTKIDVLHAAIFVNFLSTFKTDADSEKSGYWKFKGISKEALQILEQHDTFFNTHFDRALYLALVDTLIYYLPENPDNREHYFDETFYEEMNEWIDFYDHLIVEQYSKNHPNDSIFIPEAITRIANGLFMDAGNSILYDPFGHLGAFALNVNAHMAEYRDPQTPVDFISDIKEDDAICATTLRLLFHDERTLYNFQDTIKNSDGAPTYLATIPPFQKAIMTDKGETTPISYTVDKGLECVKKGGKMFCIIPSSVLINSGYENIRKKLTDTEFETKLVLLPSGSLMSTGIATTIVFINGQKHSDVIKFIDASNYVKKEGKEVKIDFISISNLCFHDSDPRENEIYDESVFQFGERFWSVKNDNTDTFDKSWYDDGFGDGECINLSKESFSHDIKITLKEEIRQNDYSLNPSFYFDHTVLAPEGFETRNLADILVKEVEVVDDNGQGKIVSARDLHANDSLIELDPEKLTTKKVSNPGGTLIYKVGIGSYLIVSRVGNLSPTAIKVTDTIYVNRNSVEVYKIVDDTIDPAYLANEMRKNYFSDQLHYTKMVSGMTNQLVLSVLNVFVPKTTETRSSLQLQKDAVEKDMLDKMGIIGEQLKRSNDERFNEYEKELHQRKHRLSQYLDNVGPALDNLRNAFAKHNGILKTSDIVSRKSGLSVDQYLDMMQDSVEKMSSLIGHLADRNHWGTPERIDIENFVTEFTEKHIHVNYKFQVVIDEASVMEAGENVEDSGHIIVKMPKDELTVVFENIVANAETWGFTDSTREDYIIKISLGIKDGDKVMLSISNNGTPIDPKTDLENLFEWGFGNHTGIGTNDARNIVRHYDGNIAIFTHPNAEDGFETEYVITIPMEI